MDKQADINITNDLKSMNKHGLEQLIKKVKFEFEKDFNQINEDHKLSLMKFFEGEQIHFKKQYKDSAIQLKSLEKNLNKVPRHFDRAQKVKIFIKKTDLKIQLGFEAQNCLMNSLINQTIKKSDPIEEEIILSQSETQSHQQNLISDKQPPLKSGDPLPRLRCHICRKKDLDVINYRRHLKENHDLIFTSYNCGVDCSFTNNGLEEFCNHLIRIHRRKTCTCSNTFQNRYQLYDHLRSCQKFFQKTESIQNQKNSNNCSNKKYQGGV